MKRKYLISLLTLLAVIVATLLWDIIKLPYDFQNQTYGVYAKQKYNPQNDTIRYILFVSLPLITFFASYLFFNKENLFSINEVITSKISYSYRKGEAEFINLFFYSIIILIVIDYFSLDFTKYNSILDMVHEGNDLTPSKNLKFNNGYWTTSFLDYGPYGNFHPLFAWKIFNIETIGSVRIYEAIISLFSKILIVYLSKKISEKLTFDKKLMTFYFIFLSIFGLSLTTYESDTDISAKFFLVLLFLIIFFQSIINNNNFFNSNFFVGLFSAISMLWYLDIGIFLNLFIFILVLYTIYRNEYTKTVHILLGLIFGWSLFFIFFPKNEIIAFFGNAKSLLSTIDYMDGLIYPTPFFSKETRATKALLTLIITGILVIIFNFDKKIKANSEVKIFFLFLYFFNLVIFKTAMLRSDTAHIKASSGLTLFLLMSVGLYFLLNYLNDLNNSKKININYFSFLKKFYLLIPITSLFLYFFIPTNTTSLKNITSSYSEMKKIVLQDDKNYLTKDYIKMLDYYKKLITKSKCVQILTNEIAIPYLLDKPTCTKYYNVMTAASTESQKTLIEELKIIKPEIILLSSESDLFDNPKPRLPIVFEYVETNYSFYNKFLGWTFVKINPNY